MKKLKFKTNINCGGCIAKVTPWLNKEPGIEKWQVDTSDPSKILTIETENVTSDTIIHLLQQAGFNAEQLN